MSLTASSTVMFFLKELGNLWHIQGPRSRAAKEALAPPNNFADKRIAVVKFAAPFRVYHDWIRIYSICTDKGQKLFANTTQ